VGGIAGQAEPYVELDLDQSTINRLLTELDTLHTMVNGAADDMDGSTSLLEYRPQHPEPLRWTLPCRQPASAGAGRRLR